MGSVEENGVEVQRTTASACLRGAVKLVGDGEETALPSAGDRKDCEGHWHFVSPITITTLLFTSIEL